MKGILTIILIAVFGGLIAYIGDKIGMKTGKKKLSIFGLRPKFTSLLITIVTGVLIASATISVLALISEDVRISLFRIKEIQQSLVNAEDNLIFAQNELNKKKLALMEVEAEIADLKIDYNELDLAFTEISKSKDILDEKFEEASLQIEKLNSQKSDLKKDIEVLNQTKDKLNADISGLKETVDNLSATSLVQANSLDMSRMNELIYEIDEVISVRNYTDYSDKSPQDLIAKFIDDINRIVSEKGAASFESENIKQFVKIDEYSLMQVYKRLSDSEEDIRLEAVATQNTFMGEPVKVMLRVVERYTFYGD